MGRDAVTAVAVENTSVSSSWKKAAVLPVTKGIAGIFPRLVMVSKAP